MEKGIIPIGDLYLDTDTDPKINKGSDYILNTVISSDGRHNIAVNIKGNMLVWGSPSPTIILGMCEDTARNRIIIFSLYGGISKISYYDIVAASTKTILSGSYDFDSNYPIYNPKVLGDLLFWTDGNMQPRCINYIRAYNYTNSISTDYKYETLNADVIKLYKKPGLALTVSAVTSSTNLIRGKSFQWAYRYVYLDGYKSVLSPYTDLYFSDISYYPNGEFKSSYGIIWYYLTFTLYSNDIEGVELFVRDNEKSDWYLYDTFKRPLSSSFQGGVHPLYYNRLVVSEEVYKNASIGLEVVSNNIDDTYITNKLTIGANYVLEFEDEFYDPNPSVIQNMSYTGNLRYIYDDKKLKIAYDQKDLIRQFDYVPLKAGLQELIEKNRIIYGNITEGFDPISVNVENSILYNNTSIDADISTYSTSIVTNSGIDYWYSRFGSYPTYSLYGVQLILRNTSTNQYSFLGVRYVSKSSDTYTTILSSLASLLTGKGVSASTVDYGTPIYYRYITIRKIQSTTEVIRVTLFCYGLKSIVKTPKFGSNYLGSITYYDKELRMSSENKFNTHISIPRYFQSGLSNLNYYAYLQCKIKHIPPIDAYYYSIDISSRTDIEEYWMLVGFNNIDWFFGTNDKYLRIRVNNIINDAHDNNGSSNINTYTYQNGDRLRIIAYTSVSPSSGGAIKPILYNRDIDVQISRMEWPSNDTQYKKDQATTPSYITDSNGNKIQNPSTSYIVAPLFSTDLNSDDFMIFEIYRPKKTNDNPAYFPVKMLAIGNPGLSNRYHQGTSQHQNPNNPVATPAIVTCNFGDTYLKLRDCRYIFPCTDDNYSDYYTSNYWNTGRPNFFDENAKQSNRTTGIRFSGRLIENTKINQLNRFDYDDLIVLKSEFGNISFLKEVGDVLKVIQTTKETSVYVEREEMQNADDSTILRTSTKVLGTVRRMLESRGSSHSKSVVRYNRNLYYWDDLRKEVIRSSPNGQIAISEYGMKTWFKNVTGYTDVVCGFDESNNIFIISFVGTTYTLAFYESKFENEKPRWISFFSFVANNYISSGNFFASSNNTDGLYKHNVDAVFRCRFYGTNYKQQINIYFNDKPSIRKLFRSLGIKSNKAWSVPTITIEADASYVRGFLSKLNVQHFTLKEGEYYAEFLNNMYTTSSVASNLDLLNGDRLRGYYVKLQLENTSNTEVWLMAITINHEPSLYY